MTSTTCRLLTKKSCREEKLPWPLDRERLQLWLSGHQCFREKEVQPMQVLLTKASRIESNNNLSVGKQNSPKPTFWCVLDW